MLGAFKQHADSELGEVRAKKHLAYEPDNPVPFAILSNIHSGLGKWRDVERIRI